MSRASRLSQIVRHGDLESPRSGLGMLRYAENAISVVTTVSSSAVGVAYCEIEVQPSDREEFIIWQASMAVTTAPGGTWGGSVDGVVWEMTMSGSTAVATEIDRDPKRCDKDAVAGAGLGKARGIIRIGPTTTVRRFALGASLVKDNAAGLLVGQVKNTPGQKSYIMAVAL